MEIFLSVIRKLEKTVFPPISLSVLLFSGEKQQQQQHKKLFFSHSGLHLGVPIIHANTTMEREFVVSH